VKKQHHIKLRLHVIFSVIVAAILLAVFVFAPDISFGAAIILLVAYTAGNGIIHTRHDVLSRDTLLEYTLISLVVLVVLVGVFF
jgi:hypothetical protein